MAVQMPYSWKPRDPADIRREARLLALALEYSWRLGAFACLYSLVDGSREASTVGEKAGFLVVVLAFCLTTRLDIATIVLALLVVSYLVAATDPAPLETIVSNALSIEFALGWVALWLVVGAGVLRSVAAEPKPGFVDRDMALLVIGWIAATQVLVATQIAAGGRWP